MTSEAQSRTTVSAAAQRTLNENLLRLRTTECMLLMWERLLTEDERVRFGGHIDEALKRHNAISLWRALHPVSLGRAVIDLASRLNLMDGGTRVWLLREIQELGDADAVMKFAVQSCRLVLRESPRTVYWNGTKIDYDWDRHSAVWNYFSTLCERAAQRQPLDQFDFSRKFAKGYVAKMRHRLTKVSEFPGDLADLIVPAGLGTQKLDLPPLEIRILRLPVPEVVEVT